MPRARPRYGSGNKRASHNDHNALRHGLTLSLSRAEHNVHCQGAQSTTPNGLLRFRLSHNTIHNILKPLTSASNFLLR